MEKAKVLEQELNYIKDDNIRQWTKEMLELIPDYIYEVPASSSKKFHPLYARQEGGLILHIRAAVRYAQEMLRCPMWGDRYSELEKDMITSALILHDGVKSGIEKQRYSIATHPLEMVKFCKQQSNEVRNIIEEEVFNKIMNLIATHMGCYTKDYTSNRDVLEQPKTAIQKFVFLCDYTVSRPCVTHDFDVPLSK
jgi:hypothetical protein